MMDGSLVQQRLFWPLVKAERLVSPMGRWLRYPPFKENPFAEMGTIKRRELRFSATIDIVYNIPLKNTFQKGIAKIPFRKVSPKYLSERYDQTFYRKHSTSLSSKGIQKGLVIPFQRYFLKV
jgi:hypothetical protein